MGSNVKVKMPVRKGIEIEAWAKCRACKSWWLKWTESDHWERLSQHRNSDHRCDCLKTRLTLVQTEVVMRDIGFIPSSSEAVQ